MSASILGFAGPGGFGGGAFNRARAAGYTDAQIKSALAGSNLKIGQRVQVALDPMRYGNDMAKRGAQAGGFSDAGSGTHYGQRAVILPEGITAGGNKGVVWASGPMTDEQIINMFKGAPRSEWVLPASVNDVTQTYQAPSGTPFVDPRASAADQMMMASGSYYGKSTSRTTPDNPYNSPMYQGSTQPAEVKRKKLSSTIGNAMSSGLNIGS